MAMTGLDAFDMTLQKTNHVLRHIEEAYGWPKDLRKQSYSALRAVLHAVRDRLTVDEAVDLAAQLPMLIRGLYYEGWKPSKVPLKMGREEFLERVQDDLNFALDPEGWVPQLVTTVFTALRHHVTEGEFEDIWSAMPKDLRDLVPVGNRTAG